MTEFRPKVQRQINMSQTNHWQMNKKKAATETQTARVQWSADDMLSIKSDQSGGEAWKESGVKVRRGFNEQETAAIVFKWHDALVAFRFQHFSCDSAEPWNSW